jgi:hypothetical protein
LSQKVSTKFDEKHHFYSSKFPSQGALCGSSYLNEEFEKLLRHRLAGHHELEKYGMTIEGKINELVQKFETDIKRSVDIYSDDFEGEILPIAGLVPTENERYMRPNRLVISK